MDGNYLDIRAGELRKSMPKRKPKLTVATIRECKRQLEAVARPMNEVIPRIGRHYDWLNIDDLVSRQKKSDNLGGYPNRCVHARALTVECESCRRM